MDATYMERQQDEGGARRRRRRRGDDFVYDTNSGYERSAKKRDGRY